MLKQIIGLLSIVAQLTVAAALVTACGGGGGAPPITVTAVTVTGLPSAPLAPMQTAQLGAQAAYSDGSVKDVTATATWGTTDASILTVSGAGLVTASGPGQAEVMASFGGVSGQAGLQVVALPAAYFLDGVEYDFEYQLDAQGRVENYRISQRPGLTYALPPAEDAALVTCTGSLYGTYECRRSYAEPQNAAYPYFVMRGEAGRLTYVSRNIRPITGSLYIGYEYGSNGLIRVSSSWGQEDGSIHTYSKANQVMQYDASDHLAGVSSETLSCWEQFCRGRGSLTTVTVDTSGRLQHADHAAYTVDDFGAKTRTTTSATDWRYGAGGFVEQGLSTWIDWGGGLNAKPVQYRSTADGWLLSRTWPDGVADEYSIVRAAAGIAEEYFTLAEPYCFYNRRAPQRIRYAWDRLPSEPLFVPRALTGLSGSDYFGIISSHHR